MDGADVVVFLLIAPPLPRYLLRPKPVASVVVVVVGAGVVVVVVVVVVDVDGETNSVVGASVVGSMVVALSSVVKGSEGSFCN